MQSRRSVGGEPWPPNLQTVRRTEHRLPDGEGATGVLGVREKLSRQTHTWANAQVSWHGAAAALIPAEVQMKTAYIQADVGWQSTASMPWKHDLAAILN